MNNENKLDPEFKAKWVAALRSGEYKQGFCLLHSRGRYCCLGVAAVLNGWDLKGEGYKFLPAIVNYGEEFDLHGSKLVTMNDTYENTFSEIADYIEENL
jgi:hypothetical protein